MTYGRLTVITGPMFGGKTTTLIRVVENAESAGDRVLVVKPAFDDRYSETSIVTHDGRSCTSHAIRSWGEIDQHTLSATLIAIDEGQFFAAPYFDGDIVEVIRSLLRMGKEVVVTGLDMDWQGLPFPVMASLIAMADEVDKVRAKCSICHAEAPKTHKRVRDGAQVQLGADELYEARCNDHWRK